MPSQKLNAELAVIHQLQRDIQSSNPEEAVEAFRSLIDRILRLTIMDQRCFVRAFNNQTDHTFGAVRMLVGPAGIKDPLVLNNGHFLRLIVDLRWDGQRLTVGESTFQYQLQKQTSEWIFRYDYLRDRPSAHPASHLHVMGSAPDYFALPQKRWTLKDVHFPTAKRVSVESIIRLLIDDFGVPCSTDASLWRAVLRESERESSF